MPEFVSFFIQALEIRFQRIVMKAVSQTDVHDLPFILLSPTKRPEMRENASNKRCCAPFVANKKPTAGI
jgi:hypothetical protein